MCDLSSVIEHVIYCRRQATLISRRNYAQRCVYTYTFVARPEEVSYERPEFQNTVKLIYILIFPLNLFIHISNTKRTKYLSFKSRRWKHFLLWFFLFSFGLIHWRLIAQFPAWNATTTTRSIFEEVKLFASCAIERSHVKLTNFLLQCVPRIEVLIWKQSHRCNINSSSLTALCITLYVVWVN